ncbi:MAG TPA: GNAT family N-acetyltransferase [Nitrospiraceae bacterium]|nr:GNAT family N-acetyltransferase [Nitrospiraceae bacterium]
MAESHAELRVDLVDWAKHEPAIRAVREAVFIREQGVPVDLEWDGLDPLCMHLLAWSDRGEPIGTARMRAEGKIERMAVLESWRGRGVGRALLRTLVELAARRGLVRVTLAAQTHAVGFYERAGFRPVGDLFMDAGIPHRLMVRDLPLPKAGEKA